MFDKVFDSAIPCCTVQRSVSSVVSDSQIGTVLSEQVKM